MAASSTPTFRVAIVPTLAEIVLRLAVVRGLEIVRKDPESHDKTVPKDRLVLLIAEGLTSGAHPAR